MSMSSIARSMVLSQTLDLKREKDRVFHLPNGKARSTVLMVEKQAAIFSAACSHNNRPVC